MAFGHPPHYEGQCPNCGSLERHRLLCLAIKSQDIIRENDRVLHFAPEPIIKEMLCQKPLQYRSADIEAGWGNLVLNIEKIELPGVSVDVVMANHVLEHVDDRKALLEIFRILVPGGRFIAMVPIIEGWITTYENSSITEPLQRELHYGQNDHLRYYGQDFRDRVRSAGFVLKEFVATGEEIVRFALIRGERVFIAEKPIV
jgi:SAM-dependent methyltransferase